jgi:hypothetical protein
VRDADNAVEDGIRFTSSMMNLRKVRIHERCTHLVAEIPVYSWDTRSSERRIEEPVKLHEDAVTTLRYGLKTKVP